MGIKWIDLTQTLTPATPTYPGDENTNIVKTATVDTDGYANSTLTTGMHTGTHIDGPLHMLVNGNTIDRWPVEAFCGEAIVVDVRGKETIGSNCLDNVKNLADKILLFYSGRSENYHQSEYFENHPILSDDMAELLAASKIKMIGIDFPSPDKMPFAVHKRLLSAGIPIAENLTNLGTLLNYTKIELIALPLKTITDSAPARIVAKVTFRKVNQ